MYQHGSKNMVILSLTEQEAAALRQLIDAAVRGQGIRIAEAGLFLDRKIAQAMEAVTKPIPGNGGTDSRASVSNQNYAQE